MKTTATSQTMNAWDVRGTYVESCNCEAACPCLFLSDPTEEDCTLLVGWHVAEGHFGDVSLDDLNVAVAVVSPGNMAQVQWSAAVYVDQQADDGQRDALTQIFTGQAGGHPARIAAHIGEVLGVTSVPIDFQSDGKRHSLRVGDVAEAQIEAIEGQGGATVTVRNHPLAIAPGQDGVVARSSSVRYADHGLHWELSGRNGLFSPFAYEAD